MKAGQRCTASFQGSKEKYPGVITKVNKDGTVFVEFEDGDKDNAVKPRDVVLEKAKRPNSRNR